MRFLHLQKSIGDRCRPKADVNGLLFNDGRTATGLACLRAPGSLLRGSTPSWKVIDALRSRHLVRLTSVTQMRTYDSAACPRSMKRSLLRAPREPSPIRDADLRRFSRFINLPAGEVDREIEDALRRVCEHLGIDLAVAMAMVARVSGSPQPHPRLLRRDELRPSEPMRQEQVPGVKNNC